MFLLFFIFSILYLLIPIIKIIMNDKLDNNSIFLYLSNYILLFSILVFYNYFNNYIYSFIISVFLMIFSFLLIRDFKSKMGYYQILSIPYFILTIYMFSYLLINLNL